MGAAVSIVECPSCSRAQEPRLLCQECGAPLSSKLDYFAALGLPRKLQIDTARLEQTYHDLGRRIHPDRFASRSAKVRDASVRATALLTRAYRALRDPVNRGLYWLELNGHKLAEDNKVVAAELAETVFEVQEQLAELREARSNGSSEPIRIEVAKRKDELANTMIELNRDLSANFARWDAAATSDDHEALAAELKSTLSKIAYLRTLLRDVERELDTTTAA